MTDEKKRHVMPEYKFGKMDQLSAVDLAALIMLGRATTAGLYSWVDRHGGAERVHAEYPQVKQALAILRAERKRTRKQQRLLAELAALNAAVGGSRAASAALMQGVQ